MTIKTTGNPPRFELKNIKYARFASEETDCFQATLLKSWSGPCGFWL